MQTRQSSSWVIYFHLPLGWSWFNHCLHEVPEDFRVSIIFHMTSSAENNMTEMSCNVNILQEVFAWLSSSPFYVSFILQRMWGFFPTNNWKRITLSGGAKVFPKYWSPLNNIDSTIGLHYCKFLTVSALKDEQSWTCIGTYDCYIPKWRNCLGYR